MSVKKPNKGFSLLEILVAVAILMVLIILSYLFIPTQITKAYDARRKADLSQIKSALEMYYSLADEFPPVLPDCHQPLIFRDQVVMPSTPCDPTTGQPYFYQIPENNIQTYRLYANLKNLSDIPITYAGCQYGCGPDCIYNYGTSSMNINLEHCPGPSPTPTEILPPPLLYACSPGGSTSGKCELYDDPDISLCPGVYPNDPTCNNDCADVDNRCKNAKGKHVPN